MGVVDGAGLERAGFDAEMVAAYKAAVESAWSKWEQERPEWRTKMMTLILDVNGLTGSAAAVLLSLRIGGSHGRVQIKKPQEIEGALLKHLRERFPLPK